MCTGSFWSLCNNLLPHPFHSSDASCEQPHIWQQQEQRAPLFARGTELSSRLQQRRDCLVDTNGYSRKSSMNPMWALLCCSLLWACKELVCPSGSLWNSESHLPQRKAHEGTLCFGQQIGHELKVESAPIEWNVRAASFSPSKWSNSWRNLLWSLIAGHCHFLHISLF
jgi:hypothetical protein